MLFKSLEMDKFWTVFEVVEGGMTKKLKEEESQED
jgi:hypothetical protein